MSSAVGGASLLTQFLPSPVNLAQKGRGWHGCGLQDEDVAEHLFHASCMVVGSREKSKTADTGKLIATECREALEICCLGSNPCPISLPL